MVPTEASPPFTPSTLQVTPVFVLPVTVAVYCDEAPSVTLVAPLRVTVTVVPPCGEVTGEASVTVRLCETEVSAMLVAVMVTLADCGLLLGAV
jgi:hypothetical protein